jgi:protein required for attachment to host cells
MPNEQADETIWFLIGDAGHARLLSAAWNGAHARDLSLVSEHTHPESRARVHDLVSDDRGRKPGSSSVMHPGLDPKNDAKEHTAWRFAHELAELLEAQAVAHQYDALVLIAPPHFLGLLKSELGPHATHRLRTTMHKDYAWLDEHTLEHRIDELFGAPPPPR